MKFSTFSLAGVAGSMVAATLASAGFQGLDILYDYRGPGGVWDDNGYGLTDLITYRIYANFDGLGDDGVLAVFGQPGDPLRVQSWDGVFHNADAFAGNTAPTDLTVLGIWDNQWDTYVTIGKTDDAGDATTTSPGFSTVTNDLGGDFSDDNVGWFVTPVDSQSIGTHVLIAQFVVADASAAEFIQLNLLTRENETFKGLAFPSPGAVALFGLAGVTCSRRRRRHLK